MLKARRTREDKIRTTIVAVGDTRQPLEDVDREGLWLAVDSVVLEEETSNVPVVDDTRAVAKQEHALEILEAEDEHAEAQVGIAETLRLCTV